MKKTILLSLAALPLLAVAGVGGKFYALAPASRPPQDLTAPDDPETVERGRYLANHVYACMACHSEVDESRPGEPLVEGTLGGGRVFPKDPYGPVELRAPNLTPFHLDEWSDGEIVRAMREGITKDGEGLFPMMPYTVYREIMSLDDALAIVAYLRTLPPVERDPGRSEVGFPVSMFVRAAPAPVETEPPPAPDPGDEEARGAFLLRAAVCGECHHTVDERRQPVPGMSYAGGVKFPAGGQMFLSPNITSHATGIAAYGDEELARAIFEGKARDGRDLFIMPWTFYAGMTPEDRAALVAAVRKIAPVEHEVLRFFAPPDEG